VKANLRALVAHAIDALRAAGTLPADLVTPEFVIERPKTRAQGDFSTNAAMLLAKAAKSNRARSRRRWSQRCRPTTDIAQVEIAGPGFINFHVHEIAWRRQIGEVFAQGAGYGRNESGKGHRAGVEFVSANPTGRCTSATAAPP
jgi:arginyl-tRNA synthetase